ncbi:hypothetical protein [Confluentibacter flavum]|uniref:Glutamine cyclotransferase n=1 Tax=Confluentibacter flavum TaxID=1909700 RepID=A0A2N3HFD6_9FLAO|nr:hypothetical protein [Confluentibacter flavum]PKQ43689.1 hypothetical protein CSW08_16940 [Confluentibacter flavum]
MKHLYYIITFFSLSIVLQDSIEPTFIEKTEFTADTLVSINDFNTTFYIVENILFKKSEEVKGIDIGYNNFQLGSITSVNTFNPLKINVFYKDFNTVVVLDNRLAEIFKVDFNAVQPYKNVTHVSTGFDNTLWVFNQDTQDLELYDYKTNAARAKTLPINGSVLDLKSNYNTCWLLTKDYLYVYNYFGSLLKKMDNDGYTQIVENNGNLILKKDNELFYLKDGTETPNTIKLPNLLINQFFVTNETLYIYDGKFLHKFKIN